MDERNRRQTDGTLLSLIQGWPWRMQVVIIVLGWFGPMAAISLFFMAIWAGWLTSPITDNKATLARVEQKLDTGINDMKVRVGRSDSLDAAMLHLQLQTCRNTAKTEIQIQRCDDFWKAR